MNVIYEPKGRAREYGALAVNLYTGGCPHRCTYCYVPSALHITRETWQSQPCRPRDAILDKLDRDLANISRRSSGQQVFLCFSCDPYPNGVDTTITREAIKAIHEAGLFVRILTKGGRDAERDFNLLLPGDAFGATLTFKDPEESQTWEPGAASPYERMAALREAHERGIRTWASLEPVIEPTDSLAMIYRTHEYVDEYKIGCWNHDARAKAIDWRRFGQEAAELLEKLGKNYFIKRDLRQRM